MRLTIPANVYGTESLRSKAGKEFTIIKALLALGEGKQEAAKFFMPLNHPEVRPGPCTLVCDVEVPREGLGLSLRVLSVAAAQSAVKAA